jgi:hypothetical protein
MNAQISKTYDDGSIEILTLPVEAARVHVGERVANAASFGITRVSVKTDGREVFWAGRGWRRACTNPTVEHPGFSCDHQITH